MHRFNASMRQHLVSRVLALTFLALSAMLTAPPAHAATLVVALDSQGNAGNCDGVGPAYSSIQAAVNEAAPGDTVFVCPGVYNEQVVVSTNNLQIRGAGADSTVLRPVVVTSNTTALTTPVPVPVVPILLVRDVVGVKVSQISVDGSLADKGAGGFVNCGFTPHFVGVFYRNASGIIETVHVTKIQSATVCSFGTRIESGNGGSASVVFRSNLVDFYGVAGIVCAGLTTACAITGNSVKGVGPIDNQSQVGITVRNGAVARIADNFITDHFYRPGNGLPFKAVGIFLVYADPASNPHLLRDNFFANNEHNVQRVSTAEVFD